MRWSGSTARAIVIWAAVVVLTLAGCAKKEKSNTEMGGTGDMVLEELEQAVLAKNWDALNIVDTMARPGEAVSLLSKLCQNEDPDIRELALNCVTMITDPNTAKILAEALADEDEDNRHYALGSLEGSDAARVAGDLVANLDNEDVEVRAGVALLLGYAEEAEPAESVRNRLEIEQSELVRRDLKLALAKLGDAEMKELFAAQMDVPDSETRRKGFEDLRYIGDRGLAPRILPALDDLGRAHLISRKSEPQARFARVCDAAVNLIGELCEQPFSFEISDSKVYSDEEIAEAKSYLQSLKAE